jgi:hypothetical protein
MLDSLRPFVFILDLHFEDQRFRELKLDIVLALAQHDLTF